ncbi:hypothetical protein [Bradyrhizobium elkanii]|uniref:hypothetical protein n=1 Tax=Bradyrhizobium elkanii TaxID=29448 RepID=UPI003F7B3F2C
MRKDPKQYSVDLNSLFNYFESLAIGVARGHYHAEIVRDQFEIILNGHVESVADIGNWSEGTTGTRDIEHFDKMIALLASWKVTTKH